MWLFGWLLGGGQFLAPWNQEQVYLSFESPLHWMGLRQRLAPFSAPACQEEASLEQARRARGLAELESWQSEHAQAAESARRLESEVQGLLEQLAEAKKGVGQAEVPTGAPEAPVEAQEAVVEAVEVAPGVGQLLEAMRKAQLEALAPKAEEWCESNGAELLEEAVSGLAADTLDLNQKTNKLYINMK